MIAYDSNVVIYAFEADTPWSVAARKVVVLGERDGAVLSLLLRQEVLTGAALDSKATEAKQRTIFDAFRNTNFFPVTTGIADRAVALSKKYGRKVRGYDAIHLATAIEHDADVFYTNDTRLLTSNITEIAVRGLVSQFPNTPSSTPRSTALSDSTK